jgi:hypothetical protein
MMPKKTANTRQKNGFDSVSLSSNDATTYCTTEATAAKEISIPPVTNTTNNPRAKIPVTA